MSKGNQPRSKSMNRGKNLELIPTDLIMEILSRFPLKSIARYHTVSKLWGSMLHTPYFTTELFMTRSSARPRLLFAVQLLPVQGVGEWLFYASPQPQNPSQKSLVVAADFHTKFRGHMYSKGYCSYSSGLINFYERWISKETLPMICNPITGQYAIFPEQKREYGLLGFDPIDKQFKVLLMDFNNPYNQRVHHILTLGTDKVKWRDIQCPLIHNPIGEKICINGVLYYSAKQIDKMTYNASHVIVCFDVRYEKFKLIDVQSSIPYRYDTKLINYKGKLGGNIIYKYDNNTTLELCMWVLEDVDKQEWSKYVYTFPVNEVVGSGNLSIIGVTTTGEIVLSKRCIEKPFYVYYVNPERNTLQHVEIQGLKDEVKYRHEVYTFVDHVEDLSLNDAKNLMNSSIYALSMKKKACSLNTIKERPKQDHWDRRDSERGELKETEGKMKTEEEETVKR